MLFQFVQIIYWLALSTWFGGALFVAIAAPIIFRTIRQRKPILPDVLSVNLEDQHATLLAGQIVGRILVRLAQVELICAAVLAVALILQVFLIDLDGSNGSAALLRAILFVAAAVIVLYDYLVLGPRITRDRQEYVEHADEPQIANPAKDRFDAAHRRSVSLLQAMLFCLLGIILFSGNIMPRRVVQTVRPAVTQDVVHGPTEQTT